VPGKKSMMNSCQGGGDREKKHQTVWCCKVQFNNWTKAVDKLCQEKLHTPTHATYIQFQLLKLVLNMSCHSGACGNATLAPTQCWMSAQYASSPVLLIPISVTGEVSHRPPIKLVHDDIMHFPHTFRFLFSFCFLTHSFYQVLPHSVFICIVLSAIFSHPTPY